MITPKTKQKKNDQGALMVVAGSSNVGKVATTSTDDDEEYFEPSKRTEMTLTRNDERIRKRTTMT